MSVFIVNKRFVFVIVVLINNGFVFMVVIIKNKTRAFVVMIPMICIRLRMTKPAEHMAVQSIL